MNLKNKIEKKKKQLDENELAPRDMFYTSY